MLVECDCENAAKTLGEHVVRICFFLSPLWHQKVCRSAACEGTVMRGVGFKGALASCTCVNLLYSPAF